MYRLTTIAEGYQPGISGFQYGEIRISSRPFKGRLLYL